MEAGGGLLQTKRLRKPESSVSDQSLNYGENCLHVGFCFRVSLPLPKPSYYVGEDR